MDFNRFRPWILVIEAVEPNNLSAPTYQWWDRYILDFDYRFAYTDILNRYYMASERAELMENFLLPADDYVLATDLRRSAHLEQQLRSAEERIKILEQKLSLGLAHP
jgi:hypothetical protein